MHVERTGEFPKHEKAFSFSTAGNDEHTRVFDPICTQVVLTVHCRSLSIWVEAGIRATFRFVVSPQI